MSAAPTPATPKGEGQMSLAGRAITFSLREAGVGIALVVLVILFMIFAPYFATGDNVSTIRAFAEQIVKTLDRGSVKGVPWPKDRRHLDAGDVVVSSKKIEQALGWRSKTSLAEGLERTRAYFEPRLHTYLK